MTLKQTIKEAVAAAVAEQVSPDRRWADAATCRHMFGLTRNILNGLADRGEIRKCKTSDSPSAGALYRVADIEEWMDERAKATGLRPEAVGKEQAA